MLHERWAAAEEARNEHQDGDADQDVHADVVWVDVQDRHPLPEAGLHAYPDGEGEQAETDELERSEGDEGKQWAISLSIHS